MSTPPDPHWHDRSVANAADAWLSEPRDTQAYQRLVEALLRRRSWLHPYLGDQVTVEAPAPPVADEGPEVLDDLGADSPPVAIGDHLPNVLDDLTGRSRTPGESHD